MNEEHRTTSRVPTSLPTSTKRSRADPLLSEPPKELSFTQWLATQGVRDDIVGDLAWYIANLPERRRPVNGSYLAWDTFIDRSPVDLRDAFHKAWLEYEEYCGDCEGD